VIRWDCVFRLTAGAIRGVVTSGATAKVRILCDLSFQVDPRAGLSESASGLSFSS